MAVEKKITYFKEPGAPENTEKLIALVKDRAKELGVKQILVPSTTGTTGVKFAKAFENEDIEVIVVTEVRGEGFEPENREKLEEMGIKILTASHAFAGLDRSYIKEVGGGISVERVTAMVLRRFSQGMKVAVEISLMAVDAGLITDAGNQEIISIGGTSKGIDTAIAVRPTSTTRFFDKERGVEIREIIAMPRSKKFY